MLPVHRPLATFVPSLVLALTVPTGHAPAQQAEPPVAGGTVTPPAPEAEPKPAGVVTRFELFAGYQFETDLDTAGNMSAARTGGQLDILIPVSEHDRLSIGLAAQATFYSFQDATALDPTGDPVGTVEHFAISGRYFHRFAERWGGYVGAGISSSGEPGADFGETLQYGAGLGVTYFFSETLSVSPGLFVRTQLEDSVLFVPMVNLDWQISEEWRLATIIRAAGTAPGLALSYSPSREWTFTLAGSYENRSYRLDDEGANPGGVFRDQRVPLDISARWNITPNVGLEATAGVSVFGELETRNANGDEFGSDDLGAAPFLGLTFIARF